MTNAELIDLFRNVERSNHPVCNGCPMKYTCDKNQITRCLFGTAADALEADEKRIAELEAQEPTEKQVVDYCHKRCLVIVEEELFQRMKATFSLIPKEGEWIPNSPFTGNCSECGGNGNLKDNYCSNCGARMKVEWE